jgi:hypothetical protein
MGVHISAPAVKFSLEWVLLGRKALSKTSEAHPQYSDSIL